MDTMPTSEIAGPAAAATLLDRARNLAPVMAAVGERIESERRLPPELLAALHEGGLFRMLLPRTFGGSEIDPASFVRVIETVAALDGSTAWCLCQGNGCAMTAAYLEPAVSETIWGRDPRGVLAWGPGAETRAVADGDGFRLTGNWAFASGGRHATWLGGPATIVEADGTPRLEKSGAPAVRTFLFPAAAVEMRDVWHVVGLRGTGSDSYSVRDLHVPYAHTVARESPAERRHSGPLYQFLAMNLYASGFAATALGLSRAMLDAFRELTISKRPRLAKAVMREDSVVQFEYGRLEGRHRAARALLLSELEQVWNAVVSSGELSIADRMRIRLASTYAIHEAKAAADGVYDLAGATAIFQGGPFERRFRDIHTVTQQVQGRKGHFTTVGSYLLGNPPDLASV